MTTANTETDRATEAPASVASTGGFGKAWKARFAWRCQNCHMGDVIEVAFPISIHHFMDKFERPHFEEQCTRACACRGPVTIYLLPNNSAEPGRAQHDLGSG